MPDPAGVVRDADTMSRKKGIVITALTARAYKIPTLSQESDGTAVWDSTTLVTVFIAAGGKKGFGYSYASSAAVAVIKETLTPVILGRDVMDIAGCWNDMCVSVRNMGRSGVAACAISAVDNALWDLKSTLLALPLIRLLGANREAIAAYGSGGFTGYSPEEITRQMDEWKKESLTLFKIKIGKNVQEDKARIEAGVKALPSEGKLFVDANGAYHPREALAMAEAMKQHNIAWFEEPVSSDDTEGMRFVRGRAPACMQIAAGEYGYNSDDFLRLLKSGAVDTLQADATRCLGLTGFLQAAALSDAFHTPLSSHCAPSLHIAAMCHARNAVHIEYFVDHARIETMLFEGVPVLKHGKLAAQTERPGFGIVFKQSDAEKYAI